MNRLIERLNRPLLAIALVAACAGGLAPEAAAQRRDIAFSSNGRRAVTVNLRLGDVNLSYSSRGRAHRPAPRCEPAPRRVFVPGRWVVETRQVWVEGRTRQVWFEAVYETRYDSCGRRYTVCVRPARYETVCEPGHYESRTVEVWQPGSWRVVHG